jgi:hypothetical protein
MMKRIHVCKPLDTRAILRGEVYYMANVLEHDGNMGVLYIASINGTL